MDHIPLLDLTPQHEVLRAELLQAFADVLDGGSFILGPNVKDFEADVAAFTGTAYAVGVNSGTDALVLSLRALGIGPGDEVITTPFTFFATAESISVLGAQPVFVDIEPRSFNLDLQQVQAAITPSTRAVVPVHLFGNPVDMTRLRRLASDRNLVLVEDAAQAFGAEWDNRRVGTFGDAAAFSFFPSKNLGGIGDGGLVVTDNPELADTVRMLRAHGGRRKYRNEMLGYNSRLDEVQAAFLRVKLPHLVEANEGRRRVAAHYEQSLRDVAGIILPVEAPGGRHVYHQFTVWIEEGRRDTVAKALNDQGIATAVYYPVPVHRLPVYEHLGVRLPVAEAAAGSVLSLPIWPTMSDEAVERVAKALTGALARRSDGHSPPGFPGN